MRIYEIECKLKHSGLYDFIIPSSRGSVGRLVDCLFRSGSFVWKINGFIQRIKCNHYPTLTGHGIFADDVNADFWTASALVNLAESCTYIRVYYAFRVCSTPGFTPSCTPSRDSRLSAMQPWTKLSWTLATPFTYYVRHLRRRGVLCCDCSILFSGWANTCNLDSKLLCGGQEPYTINSYRYEIPCPPAIPLYIYIIPARIYLHIFSPRLFSIVSIGHFFFHNKKGWRA
jgi:hypothetical protein